MSSPSLNRGINPTTTRSRLAYIMRFWAEPFLCFILPLSTLLFLTAGPHAWDAALLWTLPVWLCITADYFSPGDLSTPKPEGKEWLLDARLYVLFALQLANMALLVAVTARLTWENPSDIAKAAANIAAMRLLVGINSCCSGLAVAHELLHRPAKHLRWMGRILLWTVCYDHFALEHAHGHHRMVGTSADPATARYGESFASFFNRSVTGQWVNAWRMEGQRLQHHNVFAWLMHHRVLHGVVMELGILILISVEFGMVALMVFLYQAFAAVRILEGVNYLQHWGLTRRDAKFARAIAWATDSWFTLHTFIGLSRHADHHAHADKPCYRLRHNEEGPRLPYGYFVMILMLRLSNAHYLELAGRELNLRRDDQ